MKKKLKYQWLMEREGINDTCPNQNCSEGEIVGFRWTFTPIEKEDNFLPKFLFDEKKGVPSRFNSNEDILKCSCCALSMFKTLDSAKEKYNGMPGRVKQLLGYTHIASGQITAETGVFNKDKKTEHFDLFEFEEVELKDMFKLVDTL